MRHRLLSALPLFLGALLSDWAYASSHQVQWTNFASWLIAGGLVVAGLALLWALIDVLRCARRASGAAAIYLLLLLARSCSASSTRWCTPRTAGRRCRPA